MHGAAECRRNLLQACDTCLRINRMGAMRFGGLGGERGCAGGGVSGPRRTAGAGATSRVSLLAGKLPARRKPPIPSESISCRALPISSGSGSGAHTTQPPPCRRPPRQGHGRTLLGKSVSHQPVFSSLCWFWRSPKCLFCRPSSIACPKHARDANMPPRSPGRAKPSPGPASQAIPAFPFPRAQCSTLPAHALRSRSSTELVAHHGFITGGTAGRGMMDDCSRELKAAPTNRRIDFAAGHASGIGGIGKLEGSRSLVHTYCGTEYRHLTG